MQLNEFIGSDHPSDKITVGYEIIEEMLKRKDDLDTMAFLQVYKTTVGSPQ